MSASNIKIPKIQGVSSAGYYSNSVNTSVTYSNTVGYLSNKYYYNTDTVDSYKIKISPDKEDLKKALKEIVMESEDEKGNLEVVKDYLRSSVEKLLDDPKELIKINNLQTEEINKLKSEISDLKQCIDHIYTQLGYKSEW